MKEYKIIRGDIWDCQKWLNQWKHDFNLEIHSMHVADDNRVTILLTRDKFPYKLSSTEGR